MHFVTTLRTAEDAAEFIGAMGAEYPRHKRVILAGPPGSGKTMIARRVGWALKPFAPDAPEHTAARWLWYGAGLGAPRNTSLDVEPAPRPFRAPHHTVSLAAMTGGGRSRWRPGELSLSSWGVLFLDELVEYRRNVLDAVGHALGHGYVTHHGTRYPAAPSVVVGATSCCPCGYLDAADRVCSCTPHRLAAYRARLERAARRLDAIFVHVAAPVTELRGLDEVLAARNITRRS